MKSRSFVLLFLATALVPVFVAQNGHESSEGPKVLDALHTLKHLSAELRNSNDDHTKAEMWFKLNEAAENLAEVRGSGNHNTQGGELIRKEAKEFDSVADEAASYGVGLFWCDPNAYWSAQRAGYLQYLVLWPDGPQGEEAWWRGMLGHTQHTCFDFEGSRVEAEDMVAKFGEFLRRFPNGNHTAEAKKIRDEFKKEADSLPPESASKLAVVVIQPTKQVYAVGEGITATVSLVAGDRGVYVSRHLGVAMGNWPGFSIWLETLDGHSAQRCRSGGAMDFAGPLPSPSEVLNKEFIFLKPGEERKLEMGIECPPDKAGTYRIQAAYSPNYPETHKIAELPETRGLVLHKRIQAELIAIDVR